MRSHGVQHTVKMKVADLRKKILLSNMIARSTAAATARVIEISFVIF
jgi:hypothetical protein